MDNNTLLWMLGGYSSLVLFLLSGIWNELKSMRRTIERTSLENMRISTIVDSLPCQKGMGKCGLEL